MCAVLALLLTTLIIHYSLRHGRLSIHPSFDDIGYMASAMTRLEVFYGDPQHPYRPLIDFIADYYHNPPHSPYSELLGVAAFAIFGPHDWAPYAANALLAFFFFFFADRLLSGVRLWQRLFCLLVLACVPFTGMAVHEFRPDPAVSLVTAFGIMLALTRPFIASTKGHKAAIGALFGLAMLIKPPVFPATIVYFCSTLALVTVCDLVITRSRDIGKIIQSWILCGLPFLLIPLPHYYVNGRNIVNYINEILYGHYREAYQLRADRIVHLLYFFTGHGGSIMLGLHLFLLLGILLIGAGAMIYSRSREQMTRGVALFAMLLLSAAIPISNPTKSEFFALTFDILLAFTAIYALGQMVASEARRRPLLPLASMLLVFVTLWGGLWFRWPTRWGDFSTDWVRNRNDIGNGIYNSIFDHTVTPVDWHAPFTAILPSGDKVISNRPRAMFTAIGDLGPSLFQYMAMVDYRQATFFTAPDTLNVEDYLHAAEQADFVIASEKGSRLIADFLPNYPVQDDVLAAFRRHPTFREIGRFPFISSGKGFVLFQRAAFAGWTPISRIGPLEGPILTKDVKNRVVFWAYGPATKLKVSTPASGAYQLYWECHNGFANETITVKVDGATAHEVKVHSGEGFTPVTLPLQLTAGEHVVELDYSEWVHEEERPLAVLFQALLIEPAR